MKLHHRLTPMVLIAAAALVGSCSDKATNPNNNPPVVLELNSGDIPNGGTYVHTFANAGTYNYHCTHHTMSGSVVVSAGQPAAAGVTIANNSYSPTPAMVGINGTVTWTNTGTTHTVTSN